MLGQKVDIFIMAGKRKQLSNDIKNVIVEMRKSGHKLQEIADTLNIPRGTVSDVVVRFKRRGSVENKPHTGRHRLLDERDTRGLVRLVRSDRKTPLKDVTTRFNENRETQVSKRTVQRSLYQEGYNRRVVKKKVRIREVNRKKRVKWAREKLHWRIEGQWDRVIFSDESQVVVGNNNRIYIWRKKDEAESRDCVCPPAQRRLSVMIWGCISHYGVGTITTVNGTINRHKYIEILEDNLWPVIARHFPEQDCLFQDDNAPIHRANDVKHYKEENHINCLEWPAQSPDLNVIENVWLKLKIRLQQRVEVLNTADELSAAIKDIWENLSVDYIQGLYHSIPKRLRKVLKVKGEMTKY